ncbi:MAG: ABC transporter substrate-binding protein [Acidobacteria bacterium]|nr:ABC transporter substrate-binding protein [Acidobacteriota bacterium]
MSSTNITVRILFWGCLVALLALSLARPASRDSDALSVLMEPDGTGVWRELIAKYNRDHPGLSVRMVEGPPATNLREDLYAASFLSGTAGYDIVYCDVNWVPKFAAAGWLLDLTGRISDEDLRDYLPASLQAGSYRGRLYRVPAFTDAGVLYYRKDLVSTPPETFAELVSLSMQYRTPERWGFLWQGKQYEGLVTVYLEVLWGHGGEWIDAAQQRVLLDRPEAVRALEFLKSTVGTISPPGVTNYVEEDTRILFQSGHAVFLRNWPYVWTLMRRSRAEIIDRIGIAPMVHAEGQWSAATLGGWGFAVSKFCADPEAAWRFIDFMTRPEQLQAVQRRQGRIPARRNLVPPEMKSILDSARMRPPIPAYAQASDILQRWLSSAITGSVTPDLALREAARETRLLLGN